MKHIEHLPYGRHSRILEVRYCFSGSTEEESEAYKVKLPALGYTAS